MTYSRWATEEELKGILTKVGKEDNITKSGIPMMYDEDNIYIRDNESHSLIIGSTGSGKTQSTVLTQLRLAIKAGESFMINDVIGEVYKTLSGELKKQNYNIVVINYDNPMMGNSFNPLSLPYKYYKNGQRDKAVELLEKIGYYFCCEEKILNNVDPFWVNSSISLFVGLSLYLFEKGSEEEINLSSINRLKNDLPKVEEEVRTYDKSSLIYMHLSTIINSPNDTKGSILAVLSQLLNMFVVRESLTKQMSSTDFNIENVKKEKTAIFVINSNKPYAKRLLPILVEEVLDIVYNSDSNERRLNILLDEFESLVPFREFDRTLSLSRSYKVRFSIYLRSITDLKNSYSNENVEILKMVFGNIIYLLSNDYETLKMISNYCGEKKTDTGVEPLISIQELKMMDNFEAIILIPRIYPIRTKLLPDYKYNWNFSEEVIPFKERKDDSVKIINL